MSTLKFLIAIVLSVLIQHDTYSYNQNYDSLVRLYESNSISDSLKCLVLRNLAYSNSDPDERLHYGLELAKLADKIASPIWQANARIFIGVSHRLKSNMSLALSVLFEGANISKQYDLKDELGQCYINIADVYSIMEDHANTTKYYQSAIDIFKKTENFKSLSAALTNLGDHYFTQNILDSALYYFEQADKIDSTRIPANYKAYNLGNKGLVYAKLGQFENAEKLINESSKILQQTGDYYPISVYLTYLADISVEKGNNLKAIQYVNESLRLATEYGLKEQIRDACIKLARLHELAGNISKAYYFHKQYLIYKDSVTNMESVKKMANLRTEYEVGQKQTEVDLLTAEKKTQQVILWSIIAFAFLLVVLAVVIYNFYRSKMRTNKILETQKQELETVNRTKDKFFSIISHDLRGPVSSFYGISRMIKYLVESKDTDQLLEITEHIDQSVEGLSALLDNLLDWAMQQQGQFPCAPEVVALHPIAKDMEATFKNMAQSKKILFESRVEEGIQVFADKNMVATAIRNLINNALKFTTEGDRVTLVAATEGKQAHIQIQDTGVGISPDKLEKLFGFQDKKSTFGTSGEKGLGLGLQLVYEFINLNNGRIEVESEAGKGTTFHLFLPLEG